MASTSEARQRRPVADPGTPDPAAPIKQVAASDAKAASKSGFSVLDVLRVLGGVLLMSTAVSYLTTSGESLTWGYNPWWTRAREWKSMFAGPVSLTDEQLRAYDGSDPTKPIYLALNGTIYDVSSNRPTYGPGGSYAFFAGRDAARAFLTGCFRTDTTPDLRGVTRMYMPIEPWEREIPDDVSAEERAKMKREADVALEKFKKMSKADIKIRNERELRQAKKSMREGLEHWHVLFRGDKGKKYKQVGQVKRPKDWLKGVEKTELCEQAEKQRPVRKYD
ncbi:unnamed protein product [Periconia digitata]|uniref:Cytochrome b5 heme-binding domain-containing protein n=1 Tax=Periconia digitata TaxID=1303443 RepID=A0A9W4UK74_9PLEO|nr:unnamed protein product [Periconia digitata]